MLLGGALVVFGCTRSTDDAPPADAGPETSETIAGNDDLAIRVTLSTYSSERRIGAGAIVRVENAAGTFVEAVAGDDGVAHPKIALAKGPFDVTVAHPSSRSTVSIVGVTTAPLGDVALVTDTEPHRGVTVRGALKGRASTGRVFVDGSHLSTLSLPSGITSYVASAASLPAVPLTVVALETDDKGVPINGTFVPTIPRPTGETVLDLEFPTPAATPIRSTLHVRFPTSGLLAASDLGLLSNSDLLPGFEGPLVLRHESPCDCTTLLGGAAVKGLGGVDVDVDAWWFPTDLTPNETLLRVRAGAYSGSLQLGPPTGADPKIPFAETAEATGTTPEEVSLDIDAREWAHAHALVSGSNRRWFLYSHGRGRVRRGLPHLPSGFALSDFGATVDLQVGLASDDVHGEKPWQAGARPSVVLRDPQKLSVTATNGREGRRLRCGEGPFVDITFILRDRSTPVANARVTTSVCPDVEAHTDQDGVAELLLPVSSTFDLRAEHPFYGPQPMVFGEYRAVLPEQITRVTFLPPPGELGVSLPAVLVQPLTATDCNEFAGLEIVAPGGRARYFDNLLIEHDGPMRACGFVLVEGLAPGFTTISVRNAVTGEAWIPGSLISTPRTPVVAGAVTHAIFVKAP